MLKVDIQTPLECSAEKAWGEVQKSALLLHVMRPLMRIAPLDRATFPALWIVGSTIRFRCFLLWFIPIGVRTLRFERIDPLRREMQTREHDPLVKQWDHLISIRPEGEGGAIYRDEVEIDAGILSRVVWAWACWFYRHRQGRWRKLARNL